MTLTVREFIEGLELFANEYGDNVKIVSENDWPISGVRAYDAEGTIYAIIEEG